MPRTINKQRKRIIERLKHGTTDDFNNILKEKNIKGVNDRIKELSNPDYTYHSKAIMTNIQSFESYRLADNQKKAKQLSSNANLTLGNTRETTTVTQSSATPMIKITDGEKIYNEVKSMGKNVRVVSKNTTDVNEHLKPAAQGTSDMTIKKLKITPAALRKLRKNTKKEQKASEVQNAIIALKNHTAEQLNENKSNTITPPVLPDQPNQQTPVADPKDEEAIGNQTDQQPSVEYTKDEETIGNQTDQQTHVEDTKDEETIENKGWLTNMLSKIYDFFQDCYNSFMKIIFPNDSARNTNNKRAYDQLDLSLDDDKNGAYLYTKIVSHPFTPPTPAATSNEKENETYVDDPSNSSANKL